MTELRCPECDQDLEAGLVRLVIDCPACSTQVEVVARRPSTVDPI
jgi:Zn finger protein HypA/HybF involved in hydrogenase expression